MKIIIRKGKELSKKEIINIISNYHLGKLKTHKRIFTASNLIYIIRTNRGKYILKLCLNSDKGSIEFQSRLMVFLKESGVVVPKTIETNKGEVLLEWKKNRIIIQEFKSGNAVQYANKKLAIDMGKKFGDLDKVLSNFVGQLKDIEDKEIKQFKTIKWDTKNLFEINVKEESEKVVKEIMKLNKRKLKRSLIHGDLGEGNFLVKNNKITTILDLESAHKNYLVWELSVPISQNFITLNNVKKDLIRIFLKIYQEHIKLNKEEKKALYFFVKYRELFDMFWCYKQIKKFPKEKKELLKWTKTALRQYQLFNKISLEEWMKILK